MTASTEEPTVTDNPEQSRYEAHLGDQLAGYVEYERVGGLVAFTHTVVPDEFGARVRAERVVLAVQAALLLRHAPEYVSSAFVASRLKREPGGAYGRLPSGVDCGAILARAYKRERGVSPTLTDTAEQSAAKTR